MLKAAERPLAYLSETLGGLGKKIWSLVLKIESFIFKDRKAVNALKTNDEPKVNWLELAQSGFLLCAPEAFNTQITLEFLEKCYTNVKEFVLNSLLFLKKFKPSRIELNMIS